MAYTEGDIKKVFEQVRKDSFSDLCSDSELRVGGISSTGYSSPFDGNVYVNLEKVEEANYSDGALIGIVAHELGHQTSYRKRSPIMKWAFLWNYYFSKKKQRRIEHEADEIAIERGYGKEILVHRKEMEQYYSSKPEELKRILEVYYSSEELSALVEDSAE